MFGFKFKIYFIFHSQYSAMIVYGTLKLTLMNGVERERFCGVLLSCCPTLCSTKYLVCSIVINSGLMFLFRPTNIDNSFS